MSQSTKRREQLGMSVGAARNILCRQLLFDMAQALKRDVCYRCHKRIETNQELSIEHKTSWINQPNAVELYFDLNNIAFSHLRCNIAAVERRNQHIKVTNPPGKFWCSGHQDYLDHSAFSPSTFKHRKTRNSSLCIECRSRYRKQLRAKHATRS